MTRFIERHGRKFALSSLSLVMGFVITTGAIVLIKDKAANAEAIAKIVGSFSILVSVVMGAFSGSNAFVEGKYAAAGTPQPSKLEVAQSGPMQNSVTIGPTKPAHTKEEPILVSPE